MKIRPDLIEGVKPDQKSGKVNKPPKEAFGDILNKEVDKGTAADAAKGVAPPPVVNPLVGVQAVNAVNAIGADGQAAVTKMEGVLDKWGSYADKLASPGGDLKAAYNDLDNIARDVDSIRSKHPNLGTTNPELGAIVDELETMATAERFKFNRGDYI